MTTQERRQAAIDAVRGELVNPGVRPFRGVSTTQLNTMLYRKSPGPRYPVRTVAKADTFAAIPVEPSLTERTEMETAVQRNRLLEALKEEPDLPPVTNLFIGAAHEGWEVVPPPPIPDPEQARLVPLEVDEPDATGTLEQVAGPPMVMRWLDRFVDWMTGLLPVPKDIPGA